MDTVLSPLVTQLLAWVAAGTRALAVAMEVWRTSCPRLPAWEEALNAGLITSPGAGNVPVSLTQAGPDWLARHG